MSGAKNTLDGTQQYQSLKLLAGFPKFEIQWTIKVEWVTQSWKK